MSVIPVYVQRHSPEPPLPELQADLERARRLARLLDSEFSIAGFRFGMDAVVGLIPVVGDTVGLLAGLYPIYVVRRHGLNKSYERRMIANLLLDYVGGLLPLVGDVFDAWFKANLMNVQLLERAARQTMRAT